MDFRRRSRSKLSRARVLPTLLVMLAALFVLSGPAAAYAAVGWGENLYRQLGDGNEYAFSDVPEAISGLTGVGGVSAIAAGGRHSLALLSNGTVLAWGANEFGQLGDGGNATSDVPVAVSGLSGVTAIAAGATHSLALLSNGTVMAWGNNESGQLGDGSDRESDVPVAVKGLTGVKAIAAGEGHSLALLSGGTVMAWGNNEFGQLGDATVRTSNVPVAVHALSGVTAIAAGAAHSLALQSGGTVMAWGEDNYDQLGNSALWDAEEPPEYSDVPVAVNGVSAATAVSAGATDSLALLKGGTVSSWGGNVEGELGIGRVGGTAPPTVIAGLTGVSAVSAGAHHSMALLTNGTVTTWGADEWGQLGNGTLDTPSDAPVPVSGVAETVAVSAGGAHDLALGEPIPVVSALSPAEGATGGSVTITGLNFTGATAVDFGSVAAPSFTVHSATSIVATVPAGKRTVAITVTSPAGTSAGTALSRFTYVPAPAVKKLAPKSGPAGGGTSVTITGTSLAGASAVYFGATPATSFTVDSDEAITAISPPGALGKLDVTVVTPLGTTAVSTRDRFEYLPAVEGVSPNGGAVTGGTVVTVTGAGFALGDTATTFKFGSKRAKSVECTSSTSCTVIAPAQAAGTVDVRAKVGRATTAITPADKFTYG